jgi:hypothetical protein
MACASKRIQDFQIDALRRDKQILGIYKFRQFNFCLCNEKIIHDDGRIDNDHRESRSSRISSADGRFSFTGGNRLSRAVISCNVGSAAIRAISWRRYSESVMFCFLARATNFLCRARGTFLI